MEILDILFLIYLCLVLLIIISTLQIGFFFIEIYMFSMIFMIFINHLILGIFSINYLYSNDNTLKRIINILIGSMPIVLIISSIIPFVQWMIYVGFERSKVQATDETQTQTQNENFNNTNTLLMQKMFPILSMFFKK
jgi:hypothetical protein